MTSGVVAEEPPDLHPQQRLPAADRRVGQTTLVPAVHPCRSAPAVRAGRVTSRHVGIHPNRPTRGVDLIDPQGRQVR
jgi:hypothetical protein